MKAPARIALNPNSIVWRLLGVLITSSLLAMWIGLLCNRQLELDDAHMPAAYGEQLQALAAQAQEAYKAGGPGQAQDWLDRFRQQEGVWAVLVDPRLQPLGTTPFSAQDIQRLTFLRGLDGPVRRNRFHTIPDVKVPFPDASRGFLALTLPERYFGYDQWRLINTFTLVFPVLVLCVLLAVYIHRQLVIPLAALRKHAHGLKGDQLGERLPATLSERRDELGELSRAFNRMSQRLQGTVEAQRQLLRDISHELRTPMSRMTVALESSTSLHSLQSRVTQEMDVMKRLVDNTLTFAWLDTESPRVDFQPIAIARLWDLIVEDASFEYGWPRERMVCLADDDCEIVGHLDSLYHALENLLRNAIRHSPEQGKVYLEAWRQDRYWHICIRDEGPGVAEEHLQDIFQPFVRLNDARPSDGGFGLGLSIAKRALALQGVELQARNACPGLSLQMRFMAA